MTTSKPNNVRKMYDDTAQHYAKMMDSEIKMPIYGELLGRLHERLENIDGVLIDAACGSGHMLSMYHERFETKRPLLGLDLSPRMVDIANENFGSLAQFMVSDMRDLSEVEDSSAAALLNFFALHHLDPSDVDKALVEWARVIRPDGQLVLGAWEGKGLIDYGEESDIVALRYTQDEIQSKTESAGFEIIRCAVEPVKGFPMDAIYLEGVRQ